MALTKIGKEGITGISNSSDANAITIDSSERVGIGTSPNAKLDIKDDSNSTQAILRGRSSDNFGILDFRNNAGDTVKGQVKSDASSNLILRAGPTNDALKIDTNGHVTMPLQPSFRADKNSTAQNNIGSSAVTVTFGTERVDTNGDYNTSNSTFTAPVTGTYVLHYSMRLQAIDSASSYYNVSIETSNKSYNSIFSNDEWAGDVTYWSAERTIVADMDAADTAYVAIVFIGGAAQTDINGSANYTVFQGHLLS